PAGRGRRLTPTPIARFALEHGLPLARTSDINSLPLPAADLLVVIAFGQKVAASVIERFPLGAINLHASRLPKYRGAAPIPWAIIHGEPQTGNSVIRLAEKMDAGPILAMSSLPIGPTETAGELHDRLAADGALLVLRVVNDLAAGKAMETPQDHSQATLARKLSRDLARIDWQRPASEIARLIRGMSPWPGCRVRLVAHGRTNTCLTLLRAAHEETDPAQPARPGEILPNGAIAAGAGQVIVLDLQPEGGKPMSLEAFRHGHPWLAGMQLESI
ncbi:MAG: methionyl-tRNA formyltransferase, partial [Phycisphaerae bacterium]|nr:methionyl-tRNA formyltransferase [Phycisphaerae bacterium]